MRASSCSAAASLSLGATRSFADLTQSWMTVVSNIESLAPELLDSSFPSSENYSTEDDEMFWSLVHQGYSAIFSQPREAEDAQTLRQQWETLRPSIAKFDGVLTKIWPSEPGKHLDKLPKQDDHKLLKQVLIIFQEITGEAFKHLDVWNLLTHHSKWERVMRPLVLRGWARNLILDMCLSQLKSNTWWGLIKIKTT